LKYAHHSKESTQGIAAGQTRILERWQPKARYLESGWQVCPALRTALSIDCPAQLADLPNHDQHHPLAPVRSRAMEALWLPGNDA
jgi:hypothetical protein